MHNAARMLGGLLRRNNWDTTREIDRFRRSGRTDWQRPRHQGPHPHRGGRRRRLRRQGKKASGIPTLETTFGPDIAGAIVAWLALGSSGGLAPGGTGHQPRYPPWRGSERHGRGSRTGDRRRRPVGLAPRRRARAAGRRRHTRRRTAGRPKPACSRRSGSHPHARLHGRSGKVRTLRRTQESLRARQAAERISPS